MALVPIEQAITSDLRFAAYAPCSANAAALRYRWKSPRLIATDMDGTLAQQGKFTASLLHALEDLSAADIPVLIVTGRSAGWVSGLATYLPVAGAMAPATGKQIAENGGLFYPAQSTEAQRTQRKEKKRGASPFCRPNLVGAFA